MMADDKLVIAVGSTSNDHGVPGLEHCFQLKTVPDAQAIRRRVMSELLVSHRTTDLDTISSSISQLGTRFPTNHISRRTEEITLIRGLWRWTNRCRIRGRVG